LFQAPDGCVMAVGYTAQGDSFVAGKPRVWTEIPLQHWAPPRTFDITPDGKRLAALVVDAGGEKLPAHLTFLLNFGDELRRRAPAEK